MQIFKQGLLNTAALTTPDVYLQIVPPQTNYVTGQPTDILGLVGVASWGPVNSPTLPQPNDTFGTPALRTNNGRYDLASAMAISSQIGAQNQRCVRVTDGTDTAATCSVQDTGAATGLTLTAFYTGTEGNKLSASMAPGSKQGTYKLIIGRTGFAPEVFDNLSGTGNALWTAAATAVNSGQSGSRAPSRLAVATAGASTAFPNTSTNFAFSGGTDGATGVTDTIIVGTDGLLPTQRTGMYALRGACLGGVVNLIDMTTATQWPNVDAFAGTEAVYVPLATPSGYTYAQAQTLLNTAGVDSWSLKPMVGDWVYWQDNLNGQLRLMSPATFAAARLAALSPHLSTLNEPIPAITGTSRSQQNQPYTKPEIGAIRSARLDAIANPSVGGTYYGCQTGVNASSNPATNGDNYTRMINFLGVSLATAYGPFVGKPQTQKLRERAKAAVDAFLTDLADPNRSGGPMIGDVNNPDPARAFFTQIDKNNNSDSQVAQGYMHLKVQVKFLSIVVFMLIDLEGGQTVTVQVTGAQRLN